MPRLDAKRAEKLMEEIQQTLDSYTVETWATTSADAMPTRVIALTSRLSLEASVLQLICERYTEEPDAVADEDRLYNNPRHKLCAGIARLFRAWGTTEWESTSDRVLARRVVDEVIEDLVREAFSAGRRSELLGGDRVTFEKWWLDRG